MPGKTPPDASESRPGSRSAKVVGRSATCSGALPQGEMRPARQLARPSSSGPKGFPRRAPGEGSWPKSSARHLATPAFFGLQRPVRRGASRHAAFRRPGDASAQRLARRPRRERGRAPRGTARWTVFPEGGSTVRKRRPRSEAWLSAPADPTPCRTTTKSRRQTRQAESLRRIRTLSGPCRVRASSVHGRIRKDPAAFRRNPWRVIAGPRTEVLRAIGTSTPELSRTDRMIAARFCRDKADRGRARKILCISRQDPHRRPTANPQLYPHFVLGGETAH